MNKIRFIANQDTNYVFHMLSVSKCGYDNKYGETYRNLYAASDLSILKENEDLLTVCGGQHCGELYSVLVCEAAYAKVSAIEYYRQIIQQIENNSVPVEYQSMSDIIASICTVMVKYYDDYINNIWPVEKEKIEAYIPEVLREFEENRFTEKAEELVGCPLSTPYFTVTLVSSVQNGAEAIDISRDQDLFGIERSLMDSVYFIGHEFIIYLLFSALREENAFQSFDTWSITEGLAEYYLKKIMGDTRFFNEQQKVVEFCESLEKDNSMTAAQLYGQALKFFN